MTLALSWPLLVAGLPLSVALLARLEVRTERLRMAALASAGLAMGSGLLALVIPELAALRLDGPAFLPSWLGAGLLSVSQLSTPLVPLPATLWLITLAATPRGRLDRTGIGRTSLTTALVTCAFLTENPVVLTLVWIATSLVFLRGLSRTEHGRVRRNSGLYLWASVVLLVAGVALTLVAGAPATEEAGLVLIMGAVLIRKGIFPFHAWIPNTFDRGRIGPTVLFCAPQLGTYVAAVLVVPRASEGLLQGVAALSLATAVYGAVLALVQHDARRATGYLFVSQSALVLAGLDSTSAEALAGSLVLWVSSALAFTGMARTVLALEARRGRLDLRTYHGGYEQMPLLAAGFLVLALACTGFPGTLGFVGEEMLLEGATHEFPVLGLMVVAASAFTGMAVLRMYFSLFCGRRSRGVRLGLRRREAIVMGALAAVLVTTGIFPRLIAESRYHAAKRMIEQRAEAAARR